MVAKLKLGILPLQLEVGRWKDDPIENRMCRLCGKTYLEDEFHFVMFCDSLKDVRTKMYLDIHDKCEIDLYGNPIEVLKGMLANDNLKTFGKDLETMWAERRSKLYGEKQ